MRVSYQLLNIRYREYRENLIEWKMRKEGRGLERSHKSQSNPGALEKRWNFAN